MTRLKSSTRRSAFGLMKITKEKQGIQVCQGGNAVFRKTFSLRSKSVISSIETDLFQVRKIVGVGLNQVRGLQSSTEIVRDRKGDRREMAATMMEEDLQVKLFSDFNKDDGSTNALRCDGRNGIHLEEPLIFDESESAENCKNFSTRGLSHSTQLRSCDHRKRKNSIYQNGESNEHTVGEESLEINSRLSTSETKAVDENRELEVSDDKETFLQTSSHEDVQNREKDDLTKPKAKRGRKKKLSESISTSPAPLLLDRQRSQSRTNGSLYSLNNDDIHSINRSVDDNSQTKLHTSNEKADLIELAVSLACENYNERLNTEVLTDKKPVANTRKRNGRPPKTSGYEKPLSELISPLDDFQAVKVNQVKRRGRPPRREGLIPCSALDEKISIIDQTGEISETSYKEITADNHKVVKRRGRPPKKHGQAKVNPCDDIDDAVEPLCIENQSQGRSGILQNRKKRGRPKSSVEHSDNSKSIIVSNKRDKTFKSDALATQDNDSSCVKYRRKSEDSDLLASNSDVPIKKRRGRPPGAHNKPKDLCSIETEYRNEPLVKKKRGRPPKSDASSDSEITSKKPISKPLNQNIKSKNNTHDKTCEHPKKRGRPPGVRNKPKDLTTDRIAVENDNSYFKKKLGRSPKSSLNDSKLPKNRNHHNQFDIKEIKKIGRGAIKQKNTDSLDVLDDEQTISIENYQPLKRKPGRPPKRKLTPDHNTSPDSNKALKISNCTVSTNDSIDLLEFTDNVEEVLDTAVETPSKKRKGRRKKSKQKLKKKMESKTEEETGPCIEIVLGARRNHLNNCCQLLVQFEDGTSNWIAEREFKNVDIKKSVSKYFLHPDQDLSTIHRVPFNTYCADKASVPNTTKLATTEAKTPVGTLNSSTQNQAVDKEEENTAPCFSPQPKTVYHSRNKEIQVIKTDYVHITVQHNDSRCKRIKRETCTELIEHLEDASVDESNVVVISGIEEYFSCMKDMQQLLTFPAECETRNYDENTVALR